MKAVIEAAAFQLLRDLIESRALKKERLEDEDVRRALGDLGRLAASDDEPAQRLDAVSLLGKLREISKPISLAVEPLIARGLQAPLPRIGDWGNAEDRYYLAKAAEASDAPWIAQYAAEALAQAEVSEKLSRDKWADLAINRAIHLAEALRVVASSLREWHAHRPGDPELAYRKIIRVCEALTQSLLVADVPAGDAFGQAFLALVPSAASVSTTEGRRLREDAALAVLDLLTQTLRLRFETLFDADMYRVAGAVRGWWRPARPPDQVESRTDRIARLAMEALHILARQGVRDIQLRRTLAMALDAARVDRIGGAIASTDVSLAPEISRWLATGQDLAAPRSSETAQELNDQAADELVGRLMLTLGSHDATPDALTSVADAIEMFEPTHAAALKRTGDRLALVRQWVDALAVKRRLETYGTRGERAPYDPAIHEAAGVLRRQSEVRLSAPGVVRSLEGRPPVIVIKAAVDKI